MHDVPVLKVLQIRIIVSSAVVVDVREPNMVTGLSIPIGFIAAWLLSEGGVQADLAQVCSLLWCGLIMSTVN